MPLTRSSINPLSKQKNEKREEVLAFLPSCVRYDFVDSARYDPKKTRIQRPLINPTLLEPPEHELISYKSAERIGSASGIHTAQHLRIGTSQDQRLPVRLQAPLVVSTRRDRVKCVKAASTLTRRSPGDKFTVILSYQLVLLPATHGFEIKFGHLARPELKTSNVGLAATVGVVGILLHGFGSAFSSLLGNPDLRPFLRDHQRQLRELIPKIFLLRAVILNQLPGAAEIWNTCACALQLPALAARTAMARVNKNTEATNLLATIVHLLLKVSFLSSKPVRP